MRSKYLELSKELGITDLSGWYGVSAAAIRDSVPGRSLLKKFKSSPLKMLESLEPNHKWQPWLFSSPSRIFWRSLENQRKFLDWVQQKIDLKSPLDLVSVPSAQIIEYGGRPLLSKYNFSVHAAVAQIYGISTSLEKTSSSRGRKRKYTTPEARRQALLELEQRLGIRQKEDWYRVTYSSVWDEGLKSLFDRFYKSSIRNAVAALYPEHEWLDWKFTQVPKGFWGVEDNQRRFLEWFVQRDRPRLASRGMPAR